MMPALFDQTTIEITARGSDGAQYLFRATGSVPKFDGYLAVYEEGKDQKDEEDEELRHKLPAAEEGQTLKIREIRPEQHFTEPPPRYSEASLVKKLEELGIGRPSTYASILSVLRDRAYVRLERGRFVPEPKGRIVTAFLSSFFKHYIEYDFTADLEEKLDEVASGELPWKQLLRDFWTNFHTATEEAKELKFADVVSALDEILGPHMFPKREDGADPRGCPACGNGRLGLKLGRFGAFIGCSNYPECRFTRQLGRPDENGEAQPRELGIDPKSGETVSLKSGRFGPYVQLGEQVNGEKPPRAGIPKGIAADTIDLEMALKLLALPREVGTHPETGKPIMAGFGRFGPFLVHDGAYASLETPEEVFTVGINRAVTVLAERKAKGGGPRRGGQALKDLGAHPETGAPVKVMKGKYGPYVSDGKINATLPQGSDPGSVTMEEAVALLAARAAKGPAIKRGKKAKASKETAEPKAKKKAENGEAPNGERKPKAKRKAKPKGAPN
jgi:DNA topoisomerase-1